MHLASGRLTTHVLDTANGVPARGLALELSALSDSGPVLLETYVTNDDGRCEAPLLEGAALAPGWYELVFDVGGYFADKGQNRDDAFLGRVPVRFQVTDPTAHYHVPLLVSPFGYSTYRGS
jgi:5-hydroxyisourate hydrolase